MKPSKAASPVTDNPKEDAFYERIDPRGYDWPEDFVDENGRYDLAHVL